MVIFIFNPVTFYIIEGNKTKTQANKGSLEILTDEEIMIQVKAGANESLAFIYERHKKRFFNYFLKMTFNYEKSEDLLQNLFIRILKYKSSYKVNQPFLPWSYRMARNLVYDEAKKKYNQDHLSLEEVTDDLVEEGSSDLVIEREKYLLKAISQLPAEKREIITWCKMEGRKHEEVAGIKGISIGAVKAQVHRAMIQLKKNYFENER